MRLDEFWARVSKSDELGACWIYNGYCSSNGYGRVRYGGKKQYVHRLSWELAKSTTIPKGMHVCHTCDNRTCVNPAHLFLGTNADNHADKIAKGRQARGDGHGLRKVTEEQVLEMRRLARSGVSQSELVKTYGLSSTQVCRIVRGSRWKHLDKREERAA